MARLWNKPGIPHGGWSFVRTIENERATETCEMCDQKNIKFIDLLSHPEYDKGIKVGQDCAALMCALPNETLRLPDSKVKVYVVPNQGKWQVLAEDMQIKERFDSRGEAGMWAYDNIIFNKP